MLAQEVIISSLNNIVEDLKSDAANKGQKIPVSSFRVVTTEDGAQLIGADYFKYLVLGRGPGKAPPPDKMLEWVNSESAFSTFTEIEKRSLAYVVGQKIAREGTDIYQGKKPGIDFLGVLEKNMPDLLRELVKNQAINIQTSLSQVILK